MMAKAEKKAKHGKKKGKLPGASKLAISLLLATSPSVDAISSQPTEIVQEIKKGPKTEKDDFKEWLEQGWEKAGKLFGKKIKNIKPPGRITVKSVSKKDYEDELEIEGSVESFPTPQGRIIIKAISGNSLYLIYSDDMELSKSDAQRLSSYAYLSLALEKAPESDYATFYNDESVAFLYSSMGMKQKQVQRKCSSGEALAGFAAFFVDSSDQLAFLKLVMAGDTDSIIKAVDSYFGKGGWREILYSKLNGSSELYEIMKRLTALPNGKERISEYLSFMKKFGLDAGTVKYKWDKEKERYLTIGEAAE